MSKLILLLFLGLLAYLVFKGISRSAARKRNQEAERPGSPEQMVACAHCGVFLPESEALDSGGRRFCCEAHRRLADS